MVIHFILIPGVLCSLPALCAHVHEASAQTGFAGIPMDARSWVGS